MPDSGERCPRRDSVPFRKPGETIATHPSSLATAALQSQRLRRLKDFRFLNDLRTSPPPR